MVLAQKQICRSIGQSKDPRNRPIEINSLIFDKGVKAIPDSKGSLLKKIMSFPKINSKLIIDLNV